MISLLAINFGDYEDLHSMMKDPKFEFQTLTKLDFSNNTHTDTPPAKVLQLLPKLHTFLLSKNKISRFNVSGLLKGAPLLQEIDLSFNSISVLDDIIELGSLKHLRILNIRENPIVTKFIRIKLIEALLFPVKYKPYEAVKVLTATYNSVPSPKVNPVAEEESKKFYRMMDRTEEELESTAGKISRLCKYDHKDTLIKLAQQVCPVPRKTRFPMLTMLNGEIVSVQEVQSILMTEDLSSILETQEEESYRIKRKNMELHKTYVTRFERKQNRKRDLEIMSMKTKRIEGGTGHTDLEILQDLKEGSDMAKLNLQNGVWKKPLDVKYKDAEYSIGITEFKKMVKEYKENKVKETEEMKKRREEYRKKQRRMGKKGKKNPKGNTEFEDKMDEYEGIEEDRETKRMFSKRTESKVKPKLKIEMKYSVEQDTSDTNLEEFHDEDEKEDWTESDFFFDEEEEQEGLRISLGESGDNSLSPKRGSSSPTLKSISPRNMKKLVKQMTLMKNSFSKEKKEEGENQERAQTFVIKEEKDSITPASREHEEFKGFNLISLNPVGQSGEGGAITMHFEKRDSMKKDNIQARREAASSAMAGKRGRKFVVVNDSAPNLSISAYGKSKERSVDKSPSLQTGKSFEEKKKRDTRSKEKKAQDEAGLNLLNMLANGKGDAVSTFFNNQSFGREKPEENSNSNSKEGNNKNNTTSGEGTKRNPEEQQLEERKKYKLDKLAMSFDQEQPDQHPITGPNSAVTKSPFYVYHHDPRNKSHGGPASTTRDMANSTSSAFLQASYRKAIDVLLPNDQLLTSKSDLQSSGSYNLNKHMKMFSKDLGLGNRVGNLSVRNPVVSFRMPNSKTTDDTSRVIPKDESNMTEAKEDSVRLLHVVSQRGNNDRNQRDMIRQIHLRKRPQKGSNHQQSNSMRLSDSVRSFKISAVGGPSSPNSKSTTQQFATQTPSKADSQIIHIKSVNHSRTPQKQRVKTEIIDEHSGSSMQLTPGLASVSSLQSPPLNGTRKIKFADDLILGSPVVGHTISSMDQTPTLQLSKAPSQDRPVSNIRSSIVSHMNNKAKDARGKSDEVFNIRENVRPRTVMPRRTQVEDLIPGPKEGISEEMKLKILNGRGPKYNKLLDTAKMLDDTENIIKQSNELHDRILTENLKKLKPESVQSQILSYNQITEFMREFNGGKSLKFSNDKDVREIGEAVNEYSKIEGDGLNKFDMELKLRKLREETVGLEGADLERKYLEIQAMVKLLELQENLEAYRDIHRNTGQVNKLLDKEIKKAEHNAILATHYLKLGKYCDQEYLDKFMDDDLRLAHHMTEEVIGGGGSTSKGVYQAVKAKVSEQPKQGIDDVIRDPETAEVRKKISEKLFRKQGSLLQHVTRVKEEKNNNMKEYPYQKEEPVYEDDHHRWLNVSLVKKYEHRPMLKIEDLMEQKRRKMISDHHRNNNSAMSPAEKAIKHAEEFKAGNKMKKVLKAKVEGYIREGTKNLDDLLASENTGINARHDQKQMFNEYMKLLWEKKL